MMKSTSIPFLSTLAALGMIGGGILAILNDNYLYVAVGIYFIAKGLFIISLMKKMNATCFCKSK